MKLHTNDFGYKEQENKEEKFSISLSNPRSPGVLSLRMEFPTLKGIN